MYDTLDSLAGSMLFPTIDLKTRYGQVEVHPKDRQEKMFFVNISLWQFIVIPFEVIYLFI